MTQLELNFVENYYDKNAENYYKKEGAGKFFFQDFIQIPAIRNLTKTLKYNTVLDVGCGTGLYTRYFSSIKKDVTAIDISENMLKYAKKDNADDKVQFIKGDFLHHNFEGKKFDLVFASFVLNYFNDFHAFFSKAESILANKGIVIVTTLHPIRMSSTRNNYEKYINKNYLKNGEYKSDFLSDELLPIKKYKFSDITKSLDKLKLVNIIEPAPNKIPNNEAKEEKEMFDFYTNNPSIVIFQINRK